MYQEPIRSRLGLDGPPAEWSAIADFNPDHQRSWSRLVTVDRGEDILMILHVKGLGVVTLRAGSTPTDPTGTLEFKGVGLFTADDIGYSPDL